MLPTAVDGFPCARGEQRCYLISHADHLGKLFPKEVTRDSHNNLLPSWSLTRLLPSSWYVLVYELTASPGIYRAVTEAKLLLDSYATASRSKTDAEYVAGFRAHKDLRIVLYPNALRFFWGKLFMPMQKAWPSVSQIMETGYELSADTRVAMQPLIEAAAPADSAWNITFVSAFRRRYWPAAPPPVSAPSAVPPLTGEAAQPRALEALDLDLDGLSSLITALWKGVAGSTGPPLAIPTGTGAFSDPEEYPEATPEMHLILQIAAAVDPKDPHATYRARLELTGRFAPERVTRIVARLEDTRHNGRFGHRGIEEPCDVPPLDKSLNNSLADPSLWYEDCPRLMCACGFKPEGPDAVIQWSDRMVCGELCTQCGADPMTSVPHCLGCGTAIADWRNRNWLYPRGFCGFGCDLGERCSKGDFDLALDAWCRACHAQEALARHRRDRSPWAECHYADDSEAVLQGKGSEGEAARVRRKGWCRGVGDCDENPECKRLRAEALVHAAAARATTDGPLGYWEPGAGFV
jgi:hypothetical protein